MVDGIGKVVLADGTNLRAVEVIPAYLPLEPSELDRRIVRHAISMIGAEQRCYRRLGDGLPASISGHGPRSAISRLQQAVRANDSAAKGDRGLHRRSRPDFEIALPTKNCGCTLQVRYSCSDTSSKNWISPRFCRNLTWISIAASRSKMLNLEASFALNGALDVTAQSHNDAARPAAAE